MRVLSLHLQSESEGKQTSAWMGGGEAKGRGGGGNGAGNGQAKWRLFQALNDTEHWDPRFTPEIRRTLASVSRTPLLGSVWNPNVNVDQKWSLRVEAPVSTCTDCVPDRRH